MKYENHFTIRASGGEQAEDGIQLGQRAEKLAFFSKNKFSHSDMMLYIEETHSPQQEIEKCVKHCFFERLKKTKSFIVCT